MKRRKQSTAYILIVGLFFAKLSSNFRTCCYSKEVFDNNVVIEGAKRSDYFKVINSKYKEIHKRFQFKSYGNRHILHTSFDENKYLQKDYKPFDSKESGLEMVLELFQNISDDESDRQRLSQFLMGCLPERARNFITPKDKAVDQYKDYLITAIQHNVFPKVELRWHDGKGWGVYALDMIPPGALVGIYAGEIMTKNADYERKKERRYKNEYLAEINEELCIDAEIHGNFTRFINHASKMPNKNTINFLIRIDQIPYQAFISSHIDKGQEITWDYGSDFSFEEK